MMLTTCDVLLGLETVSETSEGYQKKSFLKCETAEGYQKKWETPEVSCTTESVAAPSCTSSDGSSE